MYVTLVTFCVTFLVICSCSSVDTTLGFFLEILSLKMLFQVSASELTPDVIEDKEARQTLETLTSLADEGNIDEAENKLYEMTCDGDRQNLEIGLLFYYALNGKDDEFLEANDFSREEIMMGIQDLADRYNLSGIAEAFRTEIL